MKSYTSAELRSKFLEFYKSHGHAVIASASVIPENDPTVLFTTAGMHPLVPYLLGEKHPEGTRLTDVQKCIRTGDIDEVGDASHCTFFEMLGNWSLGDYFKREAISWSWEFLTSPEYLGIDKERLAFSVFAGDEDCPADHEAHDIWREMGVKEDHIFYLPKKNNWWGPAGVTGPCGPDTEMFVITDKEPCGPNCSPACDCGRYLEIWNDVFMQYNKNADGTFSPLSQKNVDTGMGLERTIGVLVGAKTVYETDLFSDIIAKIGELANKDYAAASEEDVRAFRVVADHVRTSTIILGDRRGVTPSNVDQGYVLRRLIRRAIRFGMNLGMPENSLSEIAKVVTNQYKDVYPELKENEAHIVEQFNLEEQKFQRTVRQGIKEFEKILSRMGENTVIDGVTAFRLYDTFGFPVEMTQELAKEHNKTVDIEGFQQRFKCGLADNSEETTKLHTATHLLLAGLKTILSPDIQQKGSNITAERLRFDFNFPRKVTKEELAQVEEFVNNAIKAAHPITCEEMTVDQAKEAGATGVFESKYGEIVKVYTMGDVSKEICGGPHANNTADLVSFKIQKEESSSSGVRRIKAVIGK